MTEGKITFDNFELHRLGARPQQLSARHVPDALDEPVALNDALAHGLRACGLEDRLEDVAIAVREFLRPRFEKTVTEFEAMRQKALGEDQ